LSILGKTIGKIFHRERREAEVQPERFPETPKFYLKALPLRSISDVEVVKREVKAGNIMILRVSPLARKSIEDVKRAVNELCEFTEEVGGDIARLGEERVVVCPSGVRIWREAPKNSISG